MKLWLVSQVRVALWRAIYPEPVKLKLTLGSQHTNCIAGGLLHINTSLVYPMCMNDEQIKCIMYLQTLNANVRKCYCQQIISKCVYVLISKTESSDSSRFGSSDTFLMMSSLIPYFFNLRCSCSSTSCLSEGSIHACVSSLFEIVNLMMSKAVSDIISQSIFWYIQESS